MVLYINLVFSIIQMWLSLSSTSGCGFRAAVGALFILKLSCPALTQWVFHYGCLGVLAGVEWDLVVLQQPCNLFVHNEEDTLISPHFKPNFFDASGLQEINESISERDHYW